MLASERDSDPGDGLLGLPPSVPSSDPGSVPGIAPEPAPKQPSRQADQVDCLAKRFGLIGVDSKWNSLMVDCSKNYIFHAYW